jgi:hypothetical protein
MKKDNFERDFVYHPDELSRKKHVRITHKIPKDRNYQKKKTWLKKNNALPRGARSLSAINRLYSFYHRKPLSTPFAEAYGMEKRAYSYIEKRGGEYVLASPKGYVSAKKYIKKMDLSTQKEIVAPPHVEIKFNHYYKSVQHVRDEFIYVIQPPVIASVAGMNKALKRVEIDVIPNILQIIKSLIRARKALYRNHDIGAICHYETKGVETSTGVSNPTAYTRVPWIQIQHLRLFEESLFDAIKTAFDIVYNYKGSSVTLFRIDVYISTPWRASAFDMLRI